MRILVSGSDSSRTSDMAGYIKELQPFSVLDVFYDINEAAAATMSSNYEAAFIDTGDDLKTCFEMAEKLKSITPRINLIFCSENQEFMADAIYLHASGYIIYPADTEKVRKQLDNLLYPCRINIMCFGNFGITVDGKPVRFKRSKSMEVLAFIVDRRSACSRKQIAAAIFEDRSYDRNCQKYLDNIIRDLIADLKNAGISELLIHENNLYCINKKICSCDYYDYMEYYRPTYKFNGEYMSQYSWSEVTLSILNNI